MHPSFEGCIFFVWYFYYLYGLYFYYLFELYFSILMIRILVP